MAAGCCAAGFLGCGGGDMQAETPIPDLDPAEVAAKAKALDEYFQIELVAREVENLGVAARWDALRTAEKPLLQAAAWQIDELVLGRATVATQLFHGVTLQRFEAGGAKLGLAGWAQWARGLSEQGYIVRHTDWHQEDFKLVEDGTGARSRLRFQVHAYRLDRDERVRVKGRAEVDWDWRSGVSARPARVRVLEATVARRAGAPAFTVKAQFKGRERPTPQRAGAGALIVRDVDRDGLPDLILGGANTLVRNRGNWKFEAEPAAPELPPGTAFGVGLAADLDADGDEDLVLATARGRLVLVNGAPGGAFPGVPVEIPLEVPLRRPTTITAGDVDGDGDLDLFLGQWRDIHDKLPQPYWNANDGHGNAALRNLGDGRFEDATEDWGLAGKRHRRTYSASFADLDGDRDLDLLVVSDFYGVDVHENDGSGRFTDVTEARIENPYVSGMAHTLADFDADGALDMLVLGMGSTTARRLERMGGPGPEDMAEHNRMRIEMGYGNRMYLGGATRFRTPGFADDITRTGWSWGTASFDFENDGDPDIYVANGHISGRTTRDYCSHFWCKDIYLAEEVGGPAFNRFLFTHHPEFADYSWDGFQANAFLLNRGGTAGFDELGFLLDIGFTFDCRRVVAADFDADGRDDLVVTWPGGTSGLRHDGGPAGNPPTVILLGNEWAPAAANHWIGVHLRPGPGRNPSGATVVARSTSGREWIDQLVSGDSFMSQHPDTIRFGLGSEAVLEWLEVRWPGGETDRLERPAVDRYHTVPGE